ncbi:hypothetical protein B0H13DRAFT_1875747 [Mycena leptocephala]|nr:hypothetical protein B0H13DRAFT_1875747 [Mycena leptocephala]
MPLLVDLLLGLAFVALNVALHLLGLVSGEGSDNAVFLALYMVGGAFHLTLGCPALYSASPAACSSWGSRVISGDFPASRARTTGTNGLNHGPFGPVGLASGLTGKKKVRTK